MRFYYFTEMPYPHLPEDYFERYGSIRVTLPNRLLDPQTTHRLYNEYLEQHQVADELGLDVMLNEHHQTATCIDAALGVSAASLVQRTRRAKILLLGYPIPHRENPLQVAEEVAMLDCISGGRIECGFVRGVGLEIHPANTNPVLNRERFYEAFTLIRKAWTTGEPFSWEGKHFHFRYANPFPQPFQKPHPPIWTTGGGDRENIDWAADNDVVFATLLAGFDGAGAVYDAYRTRCRETGRAPPPGDRFANLFLVYVGDNDADARREGEQLMWYLRTRDAPWFRAPPGWAPVKARRAMYLAGQGSVRTASYETLWDRGLLITGNADTVARRIRQFHAETGATNILMMMQAGPMRHADVLASIRRFATDVIPQLADIDDTTPARALAGSA